MKEHEFSIIETKSVPVIVNPSAICWSESPTNYTDVQVDFDFRTANMFDDILEGCRGYMSMANYKKARSIRMERLHLIQDPTTWQGCREDEILGYLDVQFEGDGVMLIYLYTFTDNIKIARGLYDDHCLDGGAKFKRLMETMDPRSRKFSTTLKDALKAYNDAYWKNEGYDQDLVIGPDYKTIEMW